jgi:hypothetical protein
MTTRTIKIKKSALDFIQLFTVENNRHDIATATPSWHSQQTTALLLCMSIWDNGSLGPALTQVKPGDEFLIQIERE